MNLETSNFSALRNAEIQATSKMTTPPTSIEFFVIGEPKAQPRAKAFARQFGAKWQARVYDPGTAEGWKGQIALAAKPHMPEQPLEGPIQLILAFMTPRPKSHFTKKGLRPNAEFWNVKKPDLDNYAKAVMDALTCLGVWKDDSQVSSLQITKRYTNSASGVNVCISPLE